MIMLNIFILVVLITKIESDSRMKFTSVGCNTSGISVINPYFRIRPKSKSSQIWIVGYEVPEPLPNVQVR